MTGGDHVDPQARAYARRKIGQLAKLAPGPVLRARVRLERAADPAVERAAMAQGTLDVNGWAVRAQVAARQFDEAVDLLEARLRHRLEHLHSRLRARRRRAPASGPGEWRHGDLGTWRRAWFPRPVEERVLVRQQRLALEPVSLEQAAADLELLDYDFHLFLEAETGHDALVWRGPGGGLGLAVCGGRSADLSGCAVSVQLAPAPPRLTPEQATRRLDLTGEPFAFFVDAASGRGAVAYRRYDGHYGIITAAGNRTDLGSG